MEDFNFSHYSSLFLRDKSLGTLIFYKDQNTQHTYEDLINSAHTKALELMALKDSFFALQMDSSYVLFTHLLAGLFAKKQMLIISNKEPESAVLNYQKNIGFTKILNDSNGPLKNNSSATMETTLDFKSIVFSILSSGSSGPSKKISLTLENVYSSSKSIIDFFNMNSTHGSFLNLPHHHIGGLMILWRAFFSKGSVTVNEEYPYHFISLVPLQLKRLLDDDAKTKKLSQCIGVLIGGATLSEELKIKAQQKNIPVYETYGMSETCSLVMLNGMALAGQEIKLDDIGHFLIKGPTLSPSVPVDDEGFYHTKDIGERKSDGSFSFKYRSDLLFKSAGEMIDPLMLEKKIKILSWINEAVVVPVKHPQWTNAACVIFSVSDESKNSEDIKNFLKNEVHPHLIPRYYFCAPKNLIAPGMKPKRFELSQWAQEQYFKQRFSTLYIAAKDSLKLMVIFHGFMEDHNDMIGLMDNHHKVSYLFIDLPGHGKTKVSSFKNRDDVFFELQSLIRFYQKDSELVMYGYSMGGRIALELSVPLKPELLILESAHFGLSTEAQKTARLQSDRKLFEDKNLDLVNFFHSWYKNPIFADYNKSSHYEAEIEKKLSHSPVEWKTSLEFFSPGATSYTITTMMEQLRDQKILGIVGSLDEKYFEHFQEMKTQLPHMHLEVIEHAGHNPHKTHLSQVKQILKKGKPKLPF